MSRWPFRPTAAKLQRVKLTDGNVVTVQTMVYLSREMQTGQLNLVKICQYFFFFFLNMMKHNLLDIHPIL